MLNIIGDIIKPDNGNLSGFKGKSISYIFQDPRLLPWKSVKENIGFVLGRDIPAEKKEKTTDHLIRLMELDEFADFYPSKLSGGMRQRVSIARAFAYPSKLLIMDEPFKSLDINNKQIVIELFN